MTRQTGVETQVAANASRRDDCIEKFTSNTITTPPSLLEQDALTQDPHYVRNAPFLLLSVDDWSQDLNIQNSNFFGTKNEVVNDDGILVVNICNCPKAGQDNLHIGMYYYFWTLFLNN
jgi:hypothetical protein